MTKSDWKWLIVLGLLISWFCINPLGAEGKTIKEVVKQAQERCVFVRTLNGQGSGVIIGRNLVLIPFHLFEFNSPIWVNGVIASIVTVSPVGDLALLKVDVKNFDPPTFGKVEVANTIFYVGSPLGLQCSVVFGRVVAIDENVVYTSAIPQPGFSGSAIWSLDGDFIGIMNQMRGDKIGGWFSIGILADKIKMFLVHANQETRQ